jgi:hypothetical protein
LSRFIAATTLGSSGKEDDAITICGHVAYVGVAHDVPLTKDCFEVRQTA